MSRCTGFQVVCSTVLPFGQTNNHDHIFHLPKSGCDYLRPQNFSPFCPEVQARYLIFLTCGWSNRMPVSKTPILTSSPRNPSFQSNSALNKSTTLDLSDSNLLFPWPATSSSSCRPTVGLVDNLHNSIAHFCSHEDRCCTVM